MASKGDIEREKKIASLVKKYAEKRDKLRKLIRNEKCTNCERMQYMLELDSLDRRGSKVKIRRRCVATGRPRGHLGGRNFMPFGRHVFRELVGQGLLPGFTQSGW